MQTAGKTENKSVNKPIVFMVVEIVSEMFKTLQAICILNQH
jgi:hypothetical protein